MKLTRRQAVVAAAGATAISLTTIRVIAQSSAATPDFEQAARDSHRENSEVLAKFDLPISTEPAFQFKA